jgi:hypothetical protein
MDDVDEMGFFLLAEDPPRELLIGFVGKIWTLTGHLQAVETARFSDHDTPGWDS